MDSISKLKFGMKTHKENYLLISFVVGFLVWLSATVLFRVAGQYFFIVDNPLVMVVLYTILIPALGLISTSVFNKFKLDNPESIKSAAIMVLPGHVTGYAMHTVF